MNEMINGIDVNLAIKDIKGIKYKNNYDEKPHKCTKRIKKYINAINNFDFNFMEVIYE